MKKKKIINFDQEVLRKYTSNKFECNIHQPPPKYFIHSKTVMLSFFFFFNKALTVMLSSILTYSHLTILLCSSSDQ